jgi:outer membrane protein OmpA-like peptidoglycan-associated protein
VIDDICLFNRALNPLEIEAMYQIAQMPVSVTPRDQGVALDASMVEGDWQGIFSQPDNTKIDNYAYWLRLQVVGQQVEGFARVEVANTDAYGVIQIKGVLGEHAITFTEGRTIREKNPTGLDWCKKFAKLRYDPQRKALIGTWYADNCKNNGEILVFASQTAFNFHGKPVAQQSSLAELRRILKQRQDHANATQAVSLVSRKIDIEPISFLSSSYQIDGPSQQYLRAEIVPFLKEAAPTLRLMISGHTDNVGVAQNNLALSIARARSVVDLLVSEGIQASRLRYNGFGDSQPISDNATPDGRRRNRRVEFEIVGE